MSEKFTGVLMLESAGCIAGNEIRYSNTFVRSAYCCFTFYYFGNNNVRIMAIGLYICEYKS